MSELNNREYYVARAAASRDLARRAADPFIAAIHLDLAARYAVLAQDPAGMTAPIMTTGVARREMANAPTLRVGQAV